MVEIVLVLERQAEIVVRQRRVWILVEHRPKLDDSPVQIAF